MFGAAIWQLGKAIDSPFKSVLKMAKLEVFLENLEQEQPLCNLLKKRVHHGDEAPGNVANIDPYALMFDQLLSLRARTSSADRGHRCAPTSLSELCLTERELRPE